ncbi:MAG: N-acetylmuramoyl-L-alanine amidase [Rhodospirillaceae bacterium]
MAGTAAGSLLLPTQALASGTASAMRLSNTGGRTRFVLELSEGVDFSIFRLADPYRIVVDLPELDWTVGNAGSPMPAPTGLIKAVRWGLFRAGDTRVVIDLSDAADVKNAFVLPATGGTPHRFVIDLEHTTKDKFMAQVGPQYRIGKQTPPVQTAQAKPDDRPRPGRTPAGTKKIVMLDPGHGGVDPGAIGTSGIYEKIITLAAAKQLKNRLEDTGRYKVVLTRERDVSVGLTERRDLAHDANADIFVSLHADSIANRAVRGLSVYTLSEKASDAEAAALADQENDADRIIGVDLSRETQEVRHILVDLAQRESMNLATRMAGRLIDQLRREAIVLRNGHRFARFAVLKSPDIPSVLIEMGYLSNKAEEVALKTEAYRSKLMAAVVRGLDEHFGTIQTVRRS